MNEPTQEEFFARFILPSGYPGVSVKTDAGDMLVERLTFNEVTVTGTDGYQLLRFLWDLSRSVEATAAEYASYIHDVEEEL